jgi:hypothetical protein
MQLAGEPLALFEGGLAARVGEQAGVLHGHGGLVSHGPEEDLLLLSGLLTRRIDEVDSAQRLTSGEERHDVDRVPRHSRVEVVYGGEPGVG